MAKNKKKTPRNEYHFHIQRRVKGSVSKDKSKIIPRKQKYNKISY